MQHFILLVSLLFSTALLAQTSVENKLIMEGQTVEVSVKNALSDKGAILFGIHSKETFMKAEAIYAESAKVVNGESIVIFENVPAGEYAVLCFHDENENGEMDFEMNGMPKESYGSSNNPFVCGPPDFELSKFEVKNKALALEIKF